jgi:uncharacterized protein (DUF427 family)
MNDYPAAITPQNTVEPVPRRIRAVLGGETVVDTTRALYLWEWPFYPQYYLPLEDVRPDTLVAEGHSQHSPWGRWRFTGCASATSTGLGPPRSSPNRP